LLQAALCIASARADAGFTAVRGQWIDPDDTWLDYSRAMGIACHVAEDIRRMQDKRQPTHSWFRARDSMDFVAWLGIDGALSYLDRLRRQARVAATAAGLHGDSRLVALTDALLDVFPRGGDPLRFRTAERLHVHFIGDMRAHPSAQ
jgi:hypothetical protein